MTLATKAAALALAATPLLFPLEASACSTANTGARCITVLPIAEEPDLLAEAALTSAAAPSPTVSVGEVLPRGEYSILLNADYYGLPPVSDGWVYMRVEHDLYRVDWQSHEVLERVTDQTAANF